MMNTVGGTPSDCSGQNGLTQDRAVKANVAASGVIAANGNVSNVGAASVLVDAAVGNTAVMDTTVMNTTAENTAKANLMTPSRLVLPLSDAPAAVSARHYAFWYGQKQALYDITLDAPIRSITALIGPSGCGKSTFLRSINRMNELTPGTRHTGQIRLHDDDIYAPSMDVVQLRQRVGMVFQRWNPFPKSIYDNVAYGPRINGVTNRAQLDELVEYSLKRATLWNEVKDRLHKSALGLSGGQQQRLCIARTLANHPEILLLDEPSSALDPIATQKLEELLYELKQDITIVIVTHNLQQAARISDYTAFFYLGRLIEMDTTENLFTRPREAQTDAYITGRFG